MIALVVFLPCLFLFPVSSHFLLFKSNLKALGEVKMNERFRETLSSLLFKKPILISS